MNRNFNCPYGEEECIWTSSHNCLNEDPSCIRAWNVSTYIDKQEGIYELHLTFTGLVPETLEGWHHSAIADDPILGPGTKFYLTTYARTIEEAYEKLLDGMISRKDFMRAKIEYIILDMRK